MKKIFTDEEGRVVGMARNILPNVSDVDMGVPYHINDGNAVSPEAVGIVVADSVNDAELMQMAQEKDIRVRIVGKEVVVEEKRGGRFVKLQAIPHFSIMKQKENERDNRPTTRVI